MKVLVRTFMVIAITTLVLFQACEDNSNSVIL
jgi:hypothetical protein